MEQMKGGGGEETVIAQNRKLWHEEGDLLQTDTIAMHSPASTNEEEPVERGGDEEIEGVNKI